MFLPNSRPILAGSLTPGVCARAGEPRIGDSATQTMLYDSVDTGRDRE
jgi:hypothetical protein